MIGASLRIEPMLPRMDTRLREALAPRMVEDLAEL